ncbi:MAG: NAD(+) synthase, partial [Atribacterota bacterium]
MTILYYFANKLNYLVVGTGNKNELTIGYFTKYGDGGVDILPLGNLLKSQVRELAEYLGIPKKIINKPPSAGLWEGQTDEEEMGISYDQLDKYLITGKLHNRVIEKKIQDKITKSAHKRTIPAKPLF